MGVEWGDAPQNPNPLRSKISLELENASLRVDLNFRYMAFKVPKIWISFLITFGVTKLHDRDATITQTF